eukprot:4174923-Pyramimonas_sp.AAC.1
MDEFAPRRGGLLRDALGDAKGSYTSYIQNSIFSAAVAICLPTIRQYFEPVAIYSPKSNCDNTYVYYA